MGRQLSSRGRYVYENITTSDVPEDEYLSNEEVLELHFLVDQANDIATRKMQ